MGTPSNRENRVASAEHGGQPLRWALLYHRSGLRISPSDRGFRDEGGKENWRPDRPPGQKRRGPGLRAASRGIAIFVIADDSDAKAKHRPCCCRSVASSRPRYTPALCRRDLPRATTFCLSAAGTVPVRPPAE